ncbi:2603_t:CDS:2 [Entrophospora sp. SA101]|nr:11316_t:CDS:2 [Entrophospora sp. SA101]CAJ0767584.1 2603_t:CDS:2 [Entrophospora sp. SA101]CAJ0843745.1 7892_t:CDS:2 [Entrophospora sp. SA101]
MHKQSLEAGILPEAHYDKFLSTRSSKIRQLILPIIRSETKLLTRIQGSLRNSFFDWYFTTSASLGNHTFFLIALPIIFWFGYAPFARGWVDFVGIGLGVVWSGYVKDMLCLPRPLSPPIQRLTVSGTLHLEYGFPSTHTTNAVSITLYFLSFIFSVDEGKAVMEMVEEDGFYNVLIKSIYVTILSTYCLTITIGRIYCGMHSITDVLAGVCIGILSWWTQWGWQNNIEELILNDSLLVPIGIIFIGIFTIYIFPEPVDDCPCFEDCVAFIGVLVGMIFGSWRHAKSSYSLHGSGVANIPYDYNIIGFPISIARIIFESSSNSNIEINENLKKNLNNNKKKRIKKNDRKSGINSVTKNKSVVIVKKLSFRNDIDVAVKFIVYAVVDLIPILFEMLGMGIGIKKDIG